MAKAKITVGIEFDVSEKSGQEQFARFLLTLKDEHPAIVQDILDRLKAEAEKRGIGFPDLVAEAK